MTELHGVGAQRRVVGLPGVRGRVSKVPLFSVRLVPVPITQAVADT